MCPLQYSDHYLFFPLYPNFTHFLFLDLFVILIPLTLCCVSCVYVDCFIYFKALPAKCSGNSSGGFEVMVLLIWLSHSGHSVNGTVRRHKEGSVKV